MRPEELISWLKSCACHKYGCAHKQALDTIEKLGSAIDNLLEDIDSDHQPEWYSEESRLAGDDPIYCRTCGAQDGSWPCVHRMALNELKEARRG